MREFEVTVTEMLKKKVVIEAETAQEAEIEATERWYDGDISSTERTLQG